MIQDLQHVIERNCPVKQEPRRAACSEGTTVRKPRLSTQKKIYRIINEYCYSRSKQQVPIPRPRRSPQFLSASLKSPRHDITYTAKCIPSRIYRPLSISLCNVTSDPANPTVPLRNPSQPNQTPCLTARPSPTCTRLYEQRGQSLWIGG